MFVGIEPAHEPLPSKEWHKHLEGLLNTGKINPDILWYLDYKQQFCINEIKKCFIRVKSRENEFVPETKYRTKVGAGNETQKGGK